MHQLAFIFLIFSTYINVHYTLCICAHGCQRSGSTFQHQILIELAELWCKEHDEPSNCANVVKGHGISDRAEQDCLEFTTCRNITESTISAISTPWEWKGSGKSAVEVSTIVEECSGKVMSAYRTSPERFAFISPYNLAVQDTEALIIQHAVALNLNLSREDAIYIKEKVNGKFDNAKLDNYTKISTINKDHVYSHPASLKSYAEEQQINQRTEDYNEWCNSLGEKFLL